MSVTQKWHVKSTLFEKIISKENHNVYKKYDAITTKMDEHNVTQGAASTGSG
jgi:hypothetical protein